VIGKIWRDIPLYSPVSENKMATSRFVEITDKEISEIKIISVPKNLCKNTKIIISLRLGDYRGIFTPT
jgi:hypothetical protein